MLELDSDPFLTSAGPPIDPIACTSIVFKLSQRRFNDSSRHKESQVCRACERMAPCPAAASVTNDIKNTAKSSVDTYALAIMRMLLRQPMLANTAAMAHIPA